MGLKIMTSQKTEKTEERLELESVARGLGVKGFLPKDDEVLKAKIAEAQGTEAVVVEKVEPVVAKEVKRSTAPRMNVSNIGRDDRTAMIDKLEREDPSCKYVMQAGTATNRELAAKGLERTEFSVKNDVVCRTQKEGYAEYVEQKNEASYEAMQRIDGGTGIVGNHNSQAKTPSKSES
jgi:hypothetical protein